MTLHLGYTVSGCKLVRSDTAADHDAHHLWGPGTTALLIIGCRIR